MNKQEDQIAHLRELYDQRFAANDEALKLQAKEYDRRLEILNHEAARILASQQKSISVEKFDGMVSQLHTKIDQYIKSTDDKVAELSKRVYYIFGGLVVLQALLKFIFKV